jgi:hypothetical protein
MHVKGRMSFDRTSCAIDVLALSLHQSWPAKNETEHYFFFTIFFLSPWIWRETASCWKTNSRSESTMTTPPPSARRHNNNLNKKLHCRSNKRYTKLISFALSRLLLIVLATSTPTSSLEFQCASFLLAFNDSFHFNPRVILDKAKPESTSAMRAWTCHGRTHKEMVEKLKSVSRRTM